MGSEAVAAGRSGAPGGRPLPRSALTRVEGRFRWGWLLAGIWLVYLAPVAPAAWHNQHPALRVVGVAVLAAFCTQYLVTFLVARQTVSGQRPALTWPRSLTSGASPLTERETEVLRAARSGGTIADLAAALHLSEGTVGNYLSAAIGKTGARTRAEAVRLAKNAGWLLT